MSENATDTIYSNKQNPLKKPCKVVVKYRFIFYHHFFKLISFILYQQSSFFPDPFAFKQLFNNALKVIEYTRTYLKYTSECSGVHLSHLASYSNLLNIFF